MYLLGQERRYVEESVSIAEAAFRHGGVPIGALVIGPDGEVLGRGQNRVMEASDPTAHAEMVVLRLVGQALERIPNRESCILYTSLEPCLMCTGAIIMAGLQNVVWAADDPVNGAVRNLLAGARHPPGFDKVNWVVQPYPDLAERSRTLMTQWQAQYKN